MAGANQEDGKRLGWLKDHQFVERAIVEHEFRLCGRS